jgi:transposase-like protein
MARPKGVGKEVRWRKLVDRQAGSGLSIREYCLKEGVSQPSFYAWRRRFREEGGHGASARSSGSRLDDAGGHEFIPLRLVEPRGVLEVIHPLGCRIRVSGEVDCQALRQVLDALDRRGGR